MSLPHAAIPAQGARVLDAPPGAHSAPLAARRDGRIQLLAAGAITLLIAVMAIGTWPVGVFQDDGIYTALGKALATGQGYRYLNLPGLPHATHYPPAYPAFLAVLWKLAPDFPSNVAIFTFANAIFLALAAALTCHFARARGQLGGVTPLVVALATVASVPPLIFGVFVLSEPMFMALLIPVLLMAERAASNRSDRDALVAGVLAGVLAMVRTPGAFVLPALVFVLLVRRRWLGAVLAAGGGALSLVPWQLWVTRHAAEVPPVLVGKYGPYAQWLTDAVRSDGVPFMARVMAKNARALFDMSWVMFSGFDPEGTPPALVLRFVIAGALLAFLAIGVVRSVRRMPVTLLFTAAYGLLVLVWPFEPTRFVWALLPLFGVLMAVGAHTVWMWRARGLPQRGIRAATLVMVPLLMAGFVTYNVRGVRQRWWESLPRENTARATPLVQWAKRYTSPDDLLATDDDVLLHLYTGRRTIPVGTFTPQEYLVAQTYSFASLELEQIIARYHPRYVMASTSYGVIAAREVMRRDPSHMRVAAVLSRGVVFERIGE